MCRSGVDLCATHVRDGYGVDVDTTNFGNAPIMRPVHTGAAWAERLRAELPRRMKASLPSVHLVYASRSCGGNVRLQSCVGESGEVQHASLAIPR